jgi:hypothetical protein
MKVMMSLRLRLRRVIVARLVSHANLVSHVSLGKSASSVRAGTMLLPRMRRAKDQKNRPRLMSPSFRQPLVCRRIRQLISMQNPLHAVAVVRAVLRSRMRKRKLQSNLNLATWLPSYAFAAHLSSGQGPRPEIVV